MALLLSACGPQDPIIGGQGCKAYVTCFEATGGTKGALDSSYGAMGACWTTTNAAATVCVRTCELELKNLQLQFPDAGCRDR